MEDAFVFEKMSLSAAASNNAYSTFSIVFNIAANILAAYMITDLVRKNVNKAVSQYSLEDEQWSWQSRLRMVTLSSFQI